VLERFSGLLPFFQLGKGSAATDAQLRIPGSQRDGLGMIGQRFFPPLHAFLRVSPEMPEIRVFRFEVESLRVGGDGTS
jgi:hypothetical protein